MAEKSKEQEDDRERQTGMLDADPAPEAEAPDAEVDAPGEQGDAAEESPAEPEAEADAETPAPTHPKETRRLARRTHAGDARPQRTPDQRQSERAEQRRDKAQSRRAWRSKVRNKRRQRRAQTPPPPAQEPRPRATGRPKTRQGVVVSDQADKTITVRIDITRRHPRYEKTVRSSSTLHAHDERNEAHTGDTVRVVESKPMSRTKRWRLLEVLERAR
jgi:small subunit ribosomal protein S17